MALLSEGRNAWIIGELAMFYAGACNVPLSVKLEESNDLLFRLTHAEVKFIMVSGNQLKKIRTIIDQLPLLEKVIVFDGDGNVLMGMGTLATVGALRPKNFIHVVFDNEVYGSTGNQPTISNVVPLEKVAKAAGYVTVERVLDRDDLVYEFKDMLKNDGPSMLLVKVNEFVEDAGRILLEPPAITARFMNAIE